jgi:hypothetical protein
MLSNWDWLPILSCFSVSRSDEGVISVSRENEEVLDSLARKGFLKILYCMGAVISFTSPALSPSEYERVKEWLDANESAKGLYYIIPDEYYIEYLMEVTT